MKKKNKEKVMGLNTKQYEFMQAISVKKYDVAGVVAGRGFGKTFLTGIIFGKIIDELPRSKWGFGGITVKQIKTVSMPLIKMTLKELYGYTEYNAKTGWGDYVLYREPPAHFERPYVEPDDWSNCMTISNGTCFELEGFKLSSLENRGKNHDGYIIDEFAFFKEEWMKIVLPTIRANVGKYTSTIHHTFFFFTSPPLTSRGIHVWKYKELAKKNPNKYLFVHGKTQDNLIFLPDNFIDNLKEQLTKFEFEVEVMGLEIKKNEKTFYPGLNEKHYVTPEEGEAYYNPNLPITFSCDFNAHFTCASVWQRPSHNESRCVGNVFVRTPIGENSMAETLALAIVERYEFHRNRKVILTGDRNGKNKSAGSNRNFYQQMKKILDANGFATKMFPINYNIMHKKKYTLVNDILAEKEDSLFTITFDAVEARSTLVSMEQAPIEPDYSKNKDSEKQGDQELATHLSDTVDYYLTYLVMGGTQLDDDDFEVEFY